MSSLNKVQIIGNLGQDVEVRFLPSGKAVANLSVATTEKWKDKEGKLKESTQWHKVNLFGSQAEVAGEYLKKGSSVYIEGRIETKEWEKDGVKRSSTEINASEMKMLGMRPNEKEAQAPQQNQKSNERPAKDGGKFAEMDDDIPF